MDFEGFISDVSFMMKIDEPEISYDCSMFPTETTMAMADIKNKVIHLRNKEPDLDLYFAIAHEMRHIWQESTDHEKWFGDYKPSNEFRNIDKYNQQPAEIDANAYAAFVMAKFFGVSPLFNGVSEKTKVKIIKRAEEYLNGDRK